MPDHLPNNLKKVGSAPHHDLMIANSENILIVVPEQRFKDTPEASLATATALQEYARRIRQKCGLVIMANNILAQEPESRRIYAQHVIPDLFFGVAMVVSNPISRIIGNMSVRLSTMQVPICAVDSIDAGISWLESLRNE